MSDVAITPPIPGAVVLDLGETFNPPFHRALGVRLALGPDGEGIAFVELDPTLHYGARWAHGGLVGALADIASGVAIARTLRDAVNVIDGTIDLKINFLRKAVDGYLTAVARTVRMGRRVAVTEVDVLNAGRLCAKALGTFMLARHLAGDE